MRRRPGFFGDRHGAGSLAAALFFFCLLAGALGMAEYFRILLIAEGVSDAAQAAAVSLLQENWDETYQARREGYAGAWQGKEGAWLPALDTADIAQRMGQTLGAVPAGGGSLYAKYEDGGSLQFRYRLTRLAVSNAPLAPADGGGVSADVSLLLEVPWWGGLWRAPPLVMPLAVSARYLPRF
ncbi:MAG: hypothetical protein LBQ15_02860 [Clostridium sp.]|jgi:hypothetical protein|nr:hypothetical protein [Clostridium sp.]